MRVVFMGTPEFAANILTELHQQHQVVCVYTRADAVRGRGKKLLPSPVKQVAVAAGIPVREPKTLRDEVEIEVLRSMNPDVICVAAYGMILPKEVLEIPPYGCLNVHASLLPKYRGAAPVERAILNGERETGVCIMKMEEGLDTGDYCISRSYEIGESSYTHLMGELADKGSYALLSALYEVESGRVRWTKQDEAQATYAEKIGPNELHLNPQDEAVVNRRRVQASTEAHAARCSIAGRGVTVLESRLADDGAVTVDQGFVAFVSKRLYLGCSDGALELLTVKPDGKREMDAAAFAAGVQGIKQGTMTWEAI